MHAAVTTDLAPIPAGAYSQGIVVNGFLYTAGQGPTDPATGATVSGGVGEQTRQVMRNLEAILASQGLTFAHVVKVTTHLQDLARDFAEYDSVYREFVVEPLPVRTTVGSTLANILVEIDVVAAFPS